ncbi:5582_t:CDS:2 [Gigaspora margarita]|uniref:5582_t:CDS:1 n=1 Tax=Gigaspora margarita TaxID=4874 RepID=A0ABN7VDF6_GIGMA|nr:5582_t:CDS:2 [Gigaspora margarita]
MTFSQATCKRCTLRNLECTFIDSGKKRGPKTDDKQSVQIYISNGPENYFDGTSMLPSVTPNPAQGHASTLSLSGYPQKQLDNIDDITLYSEFYDPEQIYIHNNFENDFDGTSMQYSMIPNLVQGHSSTIFLSEYPQQQSGNIDDVTLYSDFYEKKAAHAFQEVDPFSYQDGLSTKFSNKKNLE